MDMSFEKSRRFLLTLRVLLFAVIGSASTSQAHETVHFGKNFAEDIGHRIDVTFSGLPPEFRSEFNKADVGGVVDDIATPTTLEDADLAIIYLVDERSLYSSPFYQDLEPLESRILEGISSPVYILGLSVSGDAGPRPLRLVFYNHSAAKESTLARQAKSSGMDLSDIRCLAKRLYALSIFENSQAVLAQFSDDCGFN